MAANKKYYYLKLKDNYFDSDEIIILESMADGYKYSNILLKLYLRSPCCHLLLTQVLWRGMCYRTRSF